MAHIKLGAAFETSEKCQITDASLLRWRKNLKHAAQEWKTFMEMEFSWKT